MKSRTFHILKMCPLIFFPEAPFIRNQLFFNERYPNHVRKITAAIYSVGASFTPNIKQIYGDNFSLRIMYLRHNYHFKVALGHC